MTSPEQSLKTWVKLLIILSAVSFLATGIIWLVNPVALAPKKALINGILPPSAGIIADYLAMRHFVLGTAILALFLCKAHRLLGYFLLAGGSIQALDALTDIMHSDVPTGPIILAVVNLTAAYFVLKMNSVSDKHTA